MEVVTPPYSLFSVIGLEIEYMIVSSDTLDVLPIADTLICELVGECVRRGQYGKVAFNNELALHVFELKTPGPQPNLNGLDHTFHQAIQNINQILADKGACLLPTGMHPWMNPKLAKLWSHQDRIIYDAYHRIFNCQQHGWVNMQSVQVNLPFANDEEFAILHNAIRLLLPLMPALCASSPFIEGRIGNGLSMRSKHYGANQSRIPSTGGHLIPEYVTSQALYHDTILKPMYAAIAPFDRAATLQKEWLNARAAIPRFDRQAIEIRVIDSQESALADIAIAGAIQAVLKYIIKETDAYSRHPLSCEQLRQYYECAVHEGLEAPFSHHYVSQLGLGDKSLSARVIWDALLARGVDHLEHRYQVVLENRLIHGNLAEQLLKAAGKPLQSSKLTTVYRAMASCLEDNTLFSSTSFL